MRLGAGFAGGWSATTRDSKAPFLYFRPVVGQCLRSVVPRCGGFGFFGGDAGEREAGSLFQKQSFSFCCRCGGGEEERGTVPFKTAPFGLFWIKRVVSLKKKVPEYAFANQSLIIFNHFNCVPANSVPVPLVGRVFHFGPWPLIYAIKPSIDQ